MCFVLSFVCVGVLGACKALCWPAWCMWLNFGCLRRIAHLACLGGGVGLLAAGAGWLMGVFWVCRVSQGPLGGCSLWPV